MTSPYTISNVLYVREWSTITLQMKNRRRNRDRILKTIIDRTIDRICEYIGIFKAHRTNNETDTNNDKDAAAI